MNRDLQDVLSYFDAGAVRTRPGASEEWIRAAETRLGVRFPPSMLAILAETNGLITPDDIGFEHVPAPDAEDGLIAETNHARSALRFEAVLGIATDGSGNFYVLLTEEVDERGECPVAFIDHETNGLIAVVATSYERFLWFALDEARLTCKPNGEHKDKEIYGPWPFKKKFVLQHDPNLKPWLSGPAVARIKKKLKPPKQEVLSLAFSPVNEILAVGTTSEDENDEIIDGAVRLHELDTGQKRILIRAPGESVRYIAFAPDGSTLAVAGSTGMGRPAFAKLVNADSGETMHRLDTPPGVPSIAFSPDGNVVAVAVSKAVWLWNVHTGEVQQELPSDHSTVWSVAFSPDGAFLAFGDSIPNPTDPRSWPLQKVAIWDWRAEKLIRRFDVDKLSHAHSLAYSDDGTTLGCLDSGGDLILYEAQTGTVKHRLKNRAYGEFAFSPDCSFVAATGWRFENRKQIKFVVIWDANSGELLRELIGHKASVSALTFSPDGSTLFSGSLDGTVRQWNPETGECLAVL